MMPNKIDMIGKKFNRLTVESFSHKNKKGALFYNCRCECGEYTIVRGTKLRSGWTKSCGCIGAEKLAKRNENNTFGRLYEDPQTVSAKRVWETLYTDIPFEKFLELSQMNCFYCNIPPSKTKNFYLTLDGKLTPNVKPEWAEKAYFKYNGLDRIDSNRKHIEENCVPACFSCNIAKHDYTIEEFIEWAANIVNNLINRKIIKIENGKFINNLSEFSNIVEEYHQSRKNNENE